LARPIDLAGTTPGVGACNAGLRSDRSRSCDHRRTAFVHVVELLPVLRCFALILKLRVHRRCTGAAEGRNLSWTRPHSDPASTAVIGDTRSIVDNNGSVVDVGDIDDVNSIDGPVVIKIVSVPIAAIVAIAGVTEAIVDATVETNVKAPVAAVEAPAVVVPAPVSGGPQSAVVGWGAPGTGNPVVAGRSPVPVAGCPDIVWRRGLRLLIFGELRWRFVGIFDRLRLAVCIELFISLSVLIGLVLIGWRRSGLLRR